MLFELIREKKAIVGVIGLGYVGLPLAVETAKSGYQVIGFDINKDRVGKVNSGSNYIGDIVSEDLSNLIKNKQLSATFDFTELKKCDIIIICVPTPLDTHLQPEIAYIVNSAEEILKHRKKPSLVILESTTYPGTTEEVVKPIIEKDGSIVGKDVFIAFSPERVDPGNAQYKTKNTPKVVGGCTEKCNELASTFYSNILTGGVHVVSSPKVAEMEKLLENIFRLVNIGLINEMALLCDKMKINIWEVIDAAKTKPYGFMPFYPGPGLGGHCIPLDPYYLSWKAKEFNFQTSLIEAAGQINREMPDYVVEKIGKILNLQGKSFSNAKVVLLGVAYKKDIDDYRESPVIKIVELLEEMNCNVKVADPHVDEFKDHTTNKTYKTEKLNDILLKNADVVVITTDHTVFDKDLIIKHSKIIYDTRNFLKDNSDKIIKL